MKRLGLFIFLLLSFVITLTAQQSQSGNPFAELGYKANVATFTSFEEFHDQKQVVEIGGVLFDTRTNEVVGYVDACDSLSGLAPDVISTSIDPFCEKYYSISPYAYCFNNPVKFVDPDGKDGLDVIMGFLAAVVDNASLGTVDKRGSMNYTDAGDYNMGQNLGDAASVVIGGIEGNAGTGTAAGGLALSTSGVGTVVGVPAVEAGAAMAAHGSMMMFSGGKNLAEQKGRVSESGDSQAQKGIESETKSINQLNKEIQKRKTPEGIIRFDKGTDRKGEQPHVHIGKNALNQDGTWRHGGTKLTKEQIKYLENNGWEIPQ